MAYSIEIADATDIPKLVAIINQSYRGEGSKAGWTSEAYFVEGDKRTDKNDLLRHLDGANAVMLKAVNDGNEPSGCVYLQKRNGKLYLGMLSVKPTLQKTGIGKLLMQASEKYAAQQGLSVIMMYVVSLRSELIEWYQKQGYRDTGIRIPFPDLPEYGRPMVPIEFMIMEKQIQ